MHKLNIVILDDEDILRITLADDLVDDGFNVSNFGNPINALKFIDKNEVDVVITDMKMPEMNGIEVLEKIIALNKGIEVIVMTAYGTIDSAVNAMKLGAYDYITKPFDLDNLLRILKKIGESKELKESNNQYRSYFKAKFNLNTYIGKNKQVEELKNIVKKIVNKDTTILITGETGTGKELLANIIHYESVRQKKPLIKVSCAILSRDIFESELFGHVKGSFTGALSERKGRFEAADGGTIYLDDIDDVPLDLQVKLLRVLQEREIERVGDNKSIPINVRVLASTKVDLKKLTEEGKFREDLYYRLNVFPVNVLPLRDRRDDILELIDYFMLEANDNKPLILTNDARNLLLGYDWPGNVRELKNIAERMTILSSDHKVDTGCLPKEIIFNTDEPSTSSINLGGESLSVLLEKYELNLIKQALVTCGNNQSKAADLLQVPSSTLRTKVIKYKVKL
jgi:two-component system, NtrC family, response regulator